MAPKDILYDIISLPRHFNDLGDKSICMLLAETGYADIRDQITIDAIRESLLEHPECVVDWMQYSADKRTRSGWYFKEGRFREFVVGFVVDGDKRKESQQSYHDDRDACAAFIKKEIDSLI